MAPDETVVERLTLVDHIHHLYFEPVVLLRPGEAFWVLERTLHVRGVDGVLRTHVARESRADDCR